MSAREILSATALVKHYPVKKGRFGEKAFARAVDGITLTVNEGENLAVVGESGCGKTTLGRMLAGLVEPTAGTIRVGGGSAPRDRKKFARLVQPIFQDPYSALNPQKTVRATLAKPFKVHGMPFDDAKLASLLEEVGLSPGTSFLDRYAHELSGGQRQRIVIARALALRPKLIIADEPFSGLDATLLSQTIKLMEGLQQKFGITYVVISHDIAAVESMCKKMMVVYLGKTVEYGPTAEVIKSPIHPYTVSLLRSFPSGNPSDRKWIDEPPIAGDVPSALSPPPGCRFHPRCPLAVEDCRAHEPDLVPVSPGHFVACPVVLASRKW